MAVKRFPGFIDAHVHFRDPGSTHKEDFRSGTRAAIIGGFTFVCDMPNNPAPTFTLARVEEKIQLCKEKAVCDVGFHLGTNGLNLEDFSSAWNHPRILGLKIYCNHTTGDLLIEDHKLLDRVFAAWNSSKPMLVHAEGDQLVDAIDLARTYRRNLHVCHISQATEVAQVRQAKKEGLLITAGVTPHHLFLTDKDVSKLGAFAMMKPPLGNSIDQQALWEGLSDGTVDVVETDHAPHTKEEKQSEKPPFGVPGLETAVGLLFGAVHDKKLSEADVVRLLYDNPRKIFSIPNQENTYIELDPQKPYIVGKDGYQTKCGWSPFDGWEVYGKVETVVLHGKRIVQESKFI